MSGPKKGPKNKLLFLHFWCVAVEHEMERLSPSIFLRSWSQVLPSDPHEALRLHRFVSWRVDCCQTSIHIILCLALSIFRISFEIVVMGPVGFSGVSKMFRFHPSFLDGTKISLHMLLLGIFRNTTLRSLQAG